MSLRFRPRERRRRPGVMIVPLIDILLALLIFLMVTTTFTKTPSIQLNLPTAKNATTSTDSTKPILVTIAKDEADYYVGTEPVSESELAVRFEDWATVEAEEPNVVLRADEGVSFGRVIRIIDLAKGAGLTRVRAVIEPANDE